MKFNIYYSTGWIIAAYTQVRLIPSYLRALHLKLLTLSSDFWLFTKSSILENTSYKIVPFMKIWIISLKTLFKNCFTQIKKSQVLCIITWLHSLSHYEYLLNTLLKGRWTYTLYFLKKGRPFPLYLVRILKNSPPYQFWWFVLTPASIQGNTLTECKEIIDFIIGVRGYQGLSLLYPHHTFRVKFKGIKPLFGIVFKAVLPLEFFNNGICWP